MLSVRTWVHSPPFARSGRYRTSSSLDCEEEKAINLKRKFANGNARMVWNPSLSIPAREFDLTEGEVARIKAVIETWDGDGVNTDSGWLEPLLAAVSPEVPL